MKNMFRFLILFLVCSNAINAQKVYYIYLQTENLQPFYARMGEKIYNSTSAGYLILSNLRDSSYSLNIGIQGSQTPDQPYAISVNRKDQGFVIKNFGDKGWGLFNLNTMAVIMPAINSVSPVQAVKTERREDNAFTNLLAKAADDSTIKEKPIIEKPVEKKVEPLVVIVEKKEEPKTEVNEPGLAKQEDIKKEVTTIEKKETPKVDSPILREEIKEDVNAAQIKADSISAAKVREAEVSRLEDLRKQDSIAKLKIESITSEAEYKKSTVKLRSESSTTTGIGLVFLDMLSDDITDTIRVLIPADTRKTPPPQVKQEEKKFLDIPAGDSVQVAATKTPIKNNNCKQAASEDDFFKLRKRMVGESKDDDMIIEAGKIFRTKCFTTLQIKNLSTLFLTDEFKYKFFDSAYTHVSDLENFPSLQAELKDEYFVNRFKAMLR